jgi:hypothetical protein
MRKRLAGAMLGAGAAAVTLTAAATLPELSASRPPGTWRVSPGGSYTSGLAGPSAVLTDVSVGQSVTCTSESGAGHMNASASGSPAVLGTITSAAFTSCYDSLGDTGWKLTSSGTWNLNGYHYQGRDGRRTPCWHAGMTCGTIGNVAANVTGDILGSPCSFAVSGSAGTSSEPESTSDLPLTYSNSTGRVFLPNTETLTVSGVRGCDTLIADGDVVEFTGTVSVRPEQAIAGTPAG